MEQDQSPDEMGTQVVKVVINGVWLDEADTVYLPFLRPERALVKLNDSGARIWRTIVSNKLTAADLQDSNTRDFIAQLREAGVISELVQP